MPNHGVYVSENATSISTPVTVATGIAFIPGLAPIQNAEEPAAVNTPVLITSLNEFKTKFGWSEDFATYTLCQFAYAHFALFGVGPAIFVNLLDPATHKSAVAAADKDVTGKKVALTAKTIDDTGLVVKAQGGSGNAYVKDTDYAVYYSDEKLVVELLPASAHYNETQLNIAYNEVTPASVTAAMVATAVEKADLCMTGLGIVPDILLAPGFSHNATVAAALAAKASAINGMFKAVALVDIDTSVATDYSSVVNTKNSGNITSEYEIACWPKAKLGDYTFYLSALYAGVIAATDNDYGAPYVSPSNKALPIDALVLASGTEVNLTLAQANILNAGGVATALNFMGGFKAWGNYTACYPTNTDVKDYFIPVRRMFNWVGATLIQTFWGRLDEPMNRRFVDSILDSCNIWMNGLTGSGYILGGRVEMLDEENPTTNLMQGVIKLHVYMTPPSPAQEIDYVLEYDASYVEEAFA